MLGGDFVAFAALVTLLRDSSYTKVALNIPNFEGLTPLGFAMQNLMHWKGRIIAYNDGKTTAMDTSIGNIHSDYSIAVSMILENEHLRLHHMFDVPMQPGTARKKARLDGRILFQTKMNSDLRMLVNYCKLEYPTHLGELLSGNCGGVPDERKAVALALGIDCGHYCCSFRDSAPYKWLFNPAGMSKRAGALVRVLLRHHAGACLLEIDALRKMLQKRATDLPEQARNIHALKGEDKTRDRNRFIVLERKRINEMLSVLNSEMPGFFLGGIYACFERKYRISADTWNHILEYAGWKTKLLVIEEEDEGKEEDEG